MSDNLQLFTALKDFIGFTDADAANLRALAPVFATHGRAITESFYQRLEVNPETAPLIAGRVELLKATHLRWMSELFAGEYGEAYLGERLRIGLVHVRVGVKPWWVEAVISFLRVACIELLEREVTDPALRTAYTKSLVHLLDLDLMLINLAYADERLDRLSQCTGMSRKLIERCVLQSGQKPAPRG